MLDRIIYENHLGEKIVFGEGGLFANTNELRDYTWDYETAQSSIKSFNRSFVEKSLPYVICADRNKAIEIKNKIITIAERDVLDQIAGKIYINDEYMECYLIENINDDYLTTDTYLTAELTVLAVTGMWISTKRFIFGSNIITEDEDPLTDGKIYPYAYPYGYTNSSSEESLYNDHYDSCDFVMTIFGEAIDPIVTIAGHKYEMNDITITNGEYLVIDSVKKEIVLHKADGSKYNAFPNRNRESYIFERIPTGKVTVYHSAPFNFEVRLYKERSSPKWI